MKRTFKFTLAAIVAMLGLNSCSLFVDESVDTIVEWGFAEKENVSVSYGLESALPSAQTIINAFDNAFEKEGEALGSGHSHEVILRAQHGEKNAANNARRIAEKAASTIPSDHTCPVKGIFVVNIMYGSITTPKTVWSHDYTK